ncbi:septum formation initiator family protein [Mediterraneibacter glycyrrhizinilyticus]|uniref:FtsB family cell division protein n=1 Tax=Mediterraneibacter glycyrrhizinilyticus TaxID=342942 RepID=UPI00195F9BEE|nr:septum formation initiator family protein [Mediterraneibacter glycyrrhizinilyticus]MBM6804312.1 septum formation initiator family protein [Mediterraneibacter glycyrrhizinilyticus]MDM8124022.1 septum formation initiator family protein [Mediterraneibacter glycyrrhizinilyticus]
MNKTRRQQGAGRQQNRKKNSILRHYKRSILMICMVLVFLSGALAIGSMSLNAKNAEYKAQEEELQAQIKEEEQRSKEIDEFEDYVKTDDYIKDTAEDKLGLVDPNEIIFKPSK